MLSVPCSVNTKQVILFFFFLPCILSTFVSSYLIQDKEYGELCFAFFFSVKKKSAEHLIVVILPTAKASVKEIKY